MLRSRGRRLGARRRLPPLQRARDLHVVGLSGGTSTKGRDGIDLVLVSDDLVKRASGAFRGPRCPQGAEAVRPPRRSWWTSATPEWSGVRAAEVAVSVPSVSACRPGGPAGGLDVVPPGSLLLRLMSRSAWPSPRAAGTARPSASSTGPTERLAVAKSGKAARPSTASTGPSERLAVAKSGKAARPALSDWWCRAPLVAYRRSSRRSRSGTPSQIDPILSKSSLVNDRCTSGQLHAPPRM